MRVFAAIVLLAYIFVSDATLYSALEVDQSIDYWKDEGWKMLDRVEPHKTLELSFALKQENIEQLEELFWEVSDPDSRIYGKYLTTDQITEMIAPSFETYSLIDKWLKNEGVVDCDLVANKDYMNCRMPCKLAEKVLTGAVFFYFCHDKYHKKVIRSTSRYYIPEYIAENLDFVGQLV